MKLQPWVKYLIIAGLIVALILAVRSCSKNKNASLETASLLVDLKKEADFYKTEAGKWAAETEVVKTEYATFKEVYGSKIKDLEDQLRKKPKQVKELVEIYIEGKDTVYLTKVSYRGVPIDTGTAFEGNYLYEDKWNRFEAWVAEPTIGLNYSVTDSLSLMTWEEKGGLFKSPRTKTTVISHNPAVQIRGLESISFEQKQPLFTIGLQAGYGVTKSGLSPYAGFGAQINLGRIFR